MIIHSLARPQFICSFVDGHLGCFYSLAVVNSVVMNICEQVFVCILVSGSFGYISRSRMAVSYGNSVFFFPEL